MREMWTDFFLLYSYEGGRVYQCQRCGAMVWVRDNTNRKWERLVDGTGMHSRWHRQNNT